MICPYCLQGEVLTVMIKKTKECIQICDECDTVWIEEVSNTDGVNFDKFMKQRNCPPLWDQLEIK